MKSPHRIREPGTLVVLAALACLSAPASAQQPGAPASPGPVIEGYGAVYDVPDIELPTPVDHGYRVVFDVSRSSEEPGDLNPHLNTVARFLNMHARAGVPLERMELAVVLHGVAGKDALREEPFRERFGTRNANLELIRLLADVGVEFYMCGQTAVHRGLPDADLAESVTMALSAMTARAVLAARGYRTVN